MKKIIRGIVLVTIVLGFSLMNVSNTVEAKVVCYWNEDLGREICRLAPDEDPPNVGASWMLSAGSVGIALTPVDRTQLPVPTDPAWEVVADGVKTSGPGEICIPTRGAQFGWEYVISQTLNANSLRPLETTTSHFPDEEGQIITCANASTAGTFGIYGMFSGNPTINP